MTAQARLGPAAALLIAALAIGGCATEREAASGGILDAVTGTSLGPKATTPQPFVTASRGPEKPFMEVGVSAPARSVRPKTKAEVAAAEAALVGAGARQRAAGAAAEAQGRQIVTTAPKAPKVE